MTEETENTNDGTWSGLKKTIIGTLSTAILGAGTWLTTTFFNGHSDDNAETKTEQVAPAPAAAPVVINLSNNNEQKQQNNSGGGNTTIIKERVIEKPAPVKEEKKKEEPKEEAPW
jgi:flagellar basal body-associated protein FliL